MITEPKKICFAIMPFDNKFDDISGIIADCAAQCGLTYIRGDHRNQPGSIMPQVISDIRHSAVIVADVTDHNPNVFYELGIAHQIKGPGPVVLIAQSTVRLHEALRSQIDGEVWSIIRGPLERTKLIVRDLRRILARDVRGDLRSLTIRMISGLGTLAISDGEASDFEPEYYSSLRLSRCRTCF